MEREDDQGLSRLLSYAPSSPFRKEEGGESAMLPSKGAEHGVSSEFALGPSLLLSYRPRQRSLSLLQWSAASHPEFVVPQALRCGGCSYPREWDRSSVCNGTLSTGVCSLWLPGPEHLGILA
jgi:hypothetical protein